MYGLVCSVSKAFPNSSQHPISEGWAVKGANKTRMANPMIMMFLLVRAFSKIVSTRIINQFLTGTVTILILIRIYNPIREERPLSDHAKVSEFISQEAPQGSLNVGATGARPYGGTGYLKKYSAISFARSI